MKIPETKTIQKPNQEKSVSILTHYVFYLMILLP